MRVLPRPAYERSADATDPFANDTLRRRALAENITNIFRVSDDGLVVTVEAKWGEGKTSFIKFWHSALDQDKMFLPVYYNSFKYDFTGDPFVSIAATIYGALGDLVRGQEKQKKAAEQLDHLKKATKSLAVELAKMTAGLSVSALTGGIVSSDAVKEWSAKAFEKLTFETLEAKADEQFEAYLKSQDSVQAYQDRLLSLLSQEGPLGQRKMVVFVDELDRCRPAFAVEVLEKIKHFFNLPGVFFVLAINREQILRTISSVYGIGDDSSVYLQKFVDLEVRLPRVGAGTLTANSEILMHVGQLARELDLSDGPLSITAGKEASAFIALIGILKPSARGIEKAISLIALCLRSIKEADAAKLKDCIVVAASVRVGFPEYYSNLQGGLFFDSSSNDQGRQLFEWARSHFEGWLKMEASNVFRVEAMKVACSLLDLYEIPGARPETSDWSKIRSFSA